ncbi:MAG: PilZ domain-containing protein [Myxococcota bacterium]|nr:PilZ domain-containing protein [Myxococcota bacterium]
MKGKGLSAYLRLDAKTAGCVVEDISEGGLFIRTDRVVPVGTPIALDLVDPEQKKAIKLTGQVMGLLLKEAAERRGVPQGLRMRFDRLDGATRESLQRLMTRLGAPAEASPVFYAVTSQRPKAKVQTETLRGGGLPVVRRISPSLADSPPRRTDGSVGPPVLFRAGPEDSATRAAPLEEEESLDEDELEDFRGEAEALAPGTELGVEGLPRAEEDDLRPVLGDEEFPAHTDLGLDELPAGGTELGVESPLAPPDEEEEDEAQEEDSFSLPPPDARTVMHDVSAYRAQLEAEEEAPAPVPTPRPPARSAAESGDELDMMRAQVELLEQALRGRDERIAALETEVRQLRQHASGEPGEQTPAPVGRPRRR